MIYLITIRDMALCKIGYAINPNRRLASLATSSPFDLEIMATREGDILLERSLHRQAAAFHVRREWFTLCPEVVDIFRTGQIESLKTQIALIRAAPNLIETTRKIIGLSQAELAAALGITQSTVSRLEAGELPTSERTKLALEALLARHKDKAA